MGSTFMVLMFLVVLCPVFLSAIMMPSWTRKTESFGISVPEQIYDRSDVKKMRLTYTKWMSILSLGITALFIALILISRESEEVFSILFSGIVLLFFLLWFWVYLIFHRKMKQMKREERWEEQSTARVIIDTNFRNGKLTYSNLWYIVPFTISFLTIICSLYVYEKFPEQMPMQYNFEGEVTRYAEKSYRTVLLMPIMQLYMTFLFLFINIMISKAKQQVSDNHPETSVYKNMVFRRRWSAFLLVTGIGLTLLFGFIQISFLVEISSQVLVTVPLIFSAAVTFGAIALSVNTGQGGSRVKTGIGTEGEVMNRKDDTYWKLGQFYFNKNDPTLVIEKRFGIGWTFNFARPAAWLILIGILLAAVGIPWLLGGF
ncbi:DUF5808 domain-containing protein [Halobacillus yeomjeoni]|uniref:DUF1648 domain-containing protein n=1 Tax=Halobacillus yeomjeoni TaxID=311194 RepID=UPI001CD201B7|nr:DUF5808 domain-containing protein [Halobacillus yeomjeoni]MCA0985292.1 DUF5808 domain-containing protein [Halobacillus yeomjeoni]